MEPGTTYSSPGLGASTCPCRLGVVVVKVLLPRPTCGLAILSPCRGRTELWYPAAAATHLETL